MMEYLKQQLEAGKHAATIMSVGGNTQVALKVRIQSADTVGMVVQVKGMMGGYSAPRLLPWTSIAMVNWD